MPEITEHLPMREILTYEEIAFVCAQAAVLGIDQFRITGGEPLVRKNCAALVSMLKGIPGIRRVAMTTNGVLLQEHLEELLEAGLDAVNISLDSMDREQYRAVTGMDELERVLASVRLAAGMGAMKVLWTAREPKDHARLMRENHAVIFEGYRPTEGRDG